MGATKIMIVRHAEKPGTYNRTEYFGVNAEGDSCGNDGSEDLITLGWERAGALVTIFAPPWGPHKQLDTPKNLFASNPAKSSGGGDSGPSQRPYQTLTQIASVLGLSINSQFSKADYADMVTAALACDGAILIAWQHEDIPAIGTAILDQTQTQDIQLPSKWPGSRYDLVWVFDRPSADGPITQFSIIAQMLLAGDESAPE
jgi:hypothetical protein